MSSIQPNGPLIRSLRHHKGYSQEGLEALSRELPPGFEAITARTLRSAEAGRRIDPEKLRTIARVLEVDPETLLIEETFRIPIRGLEPYGPEDRRFMGGRDGFIREGVALLLQKGAALVVGTSGSGKSSLCLAGILPALMEADPAQALVSFRPGSDPVRALAAALAQRLVENQNLSALMATEKECLQALEADDGLARLAALAAPRFGVSGFLLYVDQGEELCSRAPPETARRFLRLLGAAIEAKEPPLRFLMSIRSDQIGEFLDLDAAFAEKLEKGTLFLRRMTRPELMEALRRPLTVGKIPYEEALLYALARDAENEAGYLPHIQFVLQDLWNSEEPPEKRLTLARYVEMGGVSGAIARHAASVYAELDSEEQRVARAVLPRLVVSAPTLSRDMAARRPLNEFDSQGKALLEKLSGASARLIHITEEEESEFAHEEIIRQWADLRLWLEEDAAENRAREKLEQDLRLWRESEEDPDYLLLTRRRFDEASALMERLAPEARPPGAERFLAVSRRTRLLRNRGLLALGGSAFLIALGLIAAGPVKAWLDEKLRPQRQAALYAEMREFGDRFYEDGKVMISPETYFPEWTIGDQDTMAFASSGHISMRTSKLYIQSNIERKMHSYIESCIDLMEKNLSFLSIPRLDFSSYNRKCGKTRMIYTNFSSSLLNGSRFPDGVTLRRLNFGGAFLVGASFPHAHISDTNFSCAVIDRADFSTARHIDSSLSQSVCLFDPKEEEPLRLPEGFPVPQHCAWTLEEEDSAERRALRRAATLAFLECAPRERAYAFSDLAVEALLANDLDKAERYLREAQELAPGPYVDLRRAYLASLRGDHEEALALYEAVRDREAPRFGAMNSLIDLEREDFASKGFHIPLLATQSARSEK